MPPWKTIQKDVTAAHILDICGMEGPYVSIKKILQDLQIDFSTAEKAATWTESDCAFIRVSATDLIEHQRFTAAHELGHLLLHRGQFECTTFADSREEDEANQFAFELLIPIRPLRRNIRKMWKLNVAKLSLVFGVTEGTMRARIEQAVQEL